VGAMVFDNSRQAKYGGMHYNNYISCHKNKMFFHLNHWHNENGRVGVAMCLRAQVQVKTLFIYYYYYL
jgi:hypothetical protein